MPEETAPDAAAGLQAARCQAGPRGGSADTGGFRISLYGVRENDGVIGPPGSVDDRRAIGGTC